MADMAPDDEQPEVGLAQALGIGPSPSGMGAGLMQGMPAVNANSTDKIAGMRDMLLAMQNPDLQTASAGSPNVSPVHVPIGAPAAVGQSAPVAAMVPDMPMPSSGGDIAALSALIESKRPDLGLEGNVMRGMLRPGFTRDLFDNYWQRSGNAVQLSGPRFKDLADYASTLPIPKDKDVSQVTGPNGETLQRRMYNLYGSPDYRYSLGTASLFYDQAGRPVGFYDNYDFDPSTPQNPKNRSLAAETAVDLMHVLGPPHGAKDFPIYYGEYVPNK